MLMQDEDASQLLAHRHFQSVRANRCMLEYALSAANDRVGRVEASGCCVGEAAPMIFSGLLHGNAHVDASRPQR